jgi:hypothetical protein
MTAEFRWFIFLAACLFCLTGATCLEMLTQGYVPVDESGKPVAGAEPVSLLSFAVPTILTMLGLRQVGNVSGLLLKPNSPVSKFITGLLGGTGLRSEGVK